MRSLPSMTPAGVREGPIEAASDDIVRQFRLIEMPTQQESAIAAHDSMQTFQTADAYSRETAFLETHVGLSGKPDEQIWNYALENDAVVVTSNARDFIRLLNVEVHPGLIILRESGLTRDEQWNRIRPVIDHILEFGDDNCLVSKLIEISGAGEWEIREIPKP